MMVVLIRESVIQDRIRSISERSLSMSKRQIAFTVIFSALFFLVLLFMLKALSKKDLEAEKENSNNFRNMANTDSLTGVRNKHAYSEAEAHLNQKIRQNEIDKLAIVVCDINGLKIVNDTLGHAAGDEVIRGFAEIIRLIRDKYDLEGKIYRIGGDEFAIIGKIDPEQYAKAKNDFDNMTAKWKGYKNNTISVSCGIAFNSQNNFTNIDDMAKYADKMMYLDKNSFYERMNIERRN